VECLVFCKHEGFIDKVQQALQQKRLSGNETLQADMTLEIPSLGVKLPFRGEIKLK